MHHPCSVHVSVRLAQEAVLRVPNGSSWRTADHHILVPAIYQPCPCLLRLTGGLLRLARVKDVTLLPGSCLPPRAPCTSPGTCVPVPGRSPLGRGVGLGENPDRAPVRGHQCQPYVAPVASSLVGGHRPCSWTSSRGGYRVEEMEGRRGVEG